MTKIAVTGTQGCGKSTLCAQLQTMFQDHGLSVFVIEEVTHSCPYPINLDATSKAHEWLWHEQLRQEFVAQNSDAEVIICDRSLMDHLCYLKRIVDKKRNLFQKHLEDTFNELHAITIPWMLTYTHIVRLPLDLEQLKSNNNPLRTKDVMFAKEIDLLFDEFVEPYNINTKEELLHWKF